MEVNVEEKVVSSDLPPAYCTLTSNGSCLDTRTSSTLQVAMSDVAEEPLVGATFLNKTARIGFIQKVLAIRFLQVFTGFAIIFAGTLLWYEAPYLRDTKSKLMILSSVLHLATIIPLFCYKLEATKRPFNVMFLVAYPLTATFTLVVFTSGYLNVTAEFCLAWYCYTIMMLGQLILSLFCLNTSLDYRMRGAMLIAALLTIITLGLTVSWFTSNFWRFSTPWLCFLTLLLFGECALTQYQLSVMTSDEYPSRLTPADFMTGTLYTYIVFGYNYSKYLKSFIAKVRSHFE